MWQLLFLCIQSRCRACGLSFICLAAFRSRPSLLPLLPPLSLSPSLPPALFPSPYLPRSLPPCVLGSQLALLWPPLLSCHRAQGPQLASGDCPAVSAIGCLIGKHSLAIDLKSGWPMSCHGSSWPGCCPPEAHCMTNDCCPSGTWPPLSEVAMLLFRSTPPTTPLA